MKLLNALIVYAIIVVLIIVVCKRYGISNFTSLTLGLLMGHLILSIIRPMSSVVIFDDDLNLMKVYITIQYITTLTLVVYIYSRAYIEYSLFNLK
jgi:hypothetical protein